MKASKAQELYSTGLTVGSLVEGVCVRPRMYTLNGTLEEAAAFLQGFYSGMGSHNQSKYAQDEVASWIQFCAWALANMGNMSEQGWYGLFRMLRQNHSEDDAAFTHLASLCIQYRQEQQNKE